MNKFHPACLTLSANKKSAVCVHVASGNMDEISSESDTNIELEILRVRNEFLEKLLAEVQSKNLILIENNALLNEKIKVMEERTKDCGEAKKKAETLVTKHGSHTKKLPSDRDEKSTTSTYSSVVEGAVINRSDLTYNSDVKEGAKNKQISSSDSQSNNSQTTEWTEVKKRKGRKSQGPRGIICDGARSYGAAFAGVARKRWIYVGRFKYKDH
ncbi:uncharacterized protein LOC123308433 isoform X2 [Coccinella septempunctata]|uniref:uncharacterized protein LOC123308433 isoform X2 n=1 Tax=Coccinella septempunctata TaxID=41139 RepID=UPI001D07A27C|nr:uncharacterized protein LOC123308433 isoform X2 [Coccinella septempunctata]